MLNMLFQKQCLPVAYALFVCAALFVSGCKQKSSSSPDYDFSRPDKTQLGKVLNEISGISYFGEKDSALLAVSDSKERVFQIDMKHVRLKDYTEKVVASNSDLEDIVKVDTALYLLMSKGILKEIPDKAKDSSGVKTYVLNLPGTNDFETIYHDPTANAIVLLCKACGDEKGQGVRTAYRFDLETKTFDPAPFFTISKDEVKAVLKDASAKFDPSAAAIHPVNKRLYILSSAGNLLVVTDTRGKVVEAYHLDPDDFPQAEGIAFSPNGDMFIANEGKYGAPTLLRFPYHRTEKKK
jgi:hypothetical protein